MTETGKGILVSCADGEVWVRILGRGTFQNGPPLYRFALEMIKRGHWQFIIDLGQCQGMDSTFLGMLAGIGLCLHEGGRNGTVRITAISDRNMDLLQTLGLDRLFEVNARGSGRANRPVPADAEFDKLPGTDIAELPKQLDKYEAADLMLEAHDNLIQVDQRNAERFVDLTRFLREKIESRNATEKKQP